MTDIAPHDEAAQWTVRVVLSLLLWSPADRAGERRNDSSTRSSPGQTTADGIEPTGCHGSGEAIRLESVCRIPLARLPEYGIPAGYRSR